MTIFEQLLLAILDEGHEVHFGKTNGVIFIRLNDEEDYIFVERSLDKIGQAVIKDYVSQSYKKMVDQGGAGKTRIDGGDK